jgi:exosortase E/protease (VPEID-CTERM system)
MRSKRVLVDAPWNTKSASDHVFAFSRWTGLIALLLGELGILALIFDPSVLSGRGSFHAFFVQRYPLALRIGIATTVAILFFGWNSLGDQLRTMNAVVRSASQTLLLLCAHALAFCALLAATVFVLGPRARFSAFPEISVGVWVALGILCLTSWCLAALPARQWLHLLHRCKLVFLGGIGVGLAAGLAGWLTDQLWQPMSRGTLWIVQRLLELSGADTICEPASFLVGTRVFSVTIEPACSGYEGIGLVWVFLAVYLWLDRASLRFPHVLLLFPIGTLVVWLANALRIFLLIGIGSRVSPQLAEEGFHTQAGWLAFIAVALGIVAVTQRAALFSARPRTRSANSTAAYLVPFLAIIAMAMISTALLEGFDYFYPLRVVVLACALWLFRRRYMGLGWSWSWPAPLAGAAVALLWIALEPFASGSGSASPISGGLRSLPAVVATAWLVFRLAGYVLLVPLAEELAFRGYLMRWLISSDFESVPLGKFSWLSILGSSVAFGVLHQERWLVGSLAGLAYALVLCRSGSFADCVLAHATTNGLLAIYVLATGQWSLLS